MEALAETGGSSGTFAETVYAWKSAEEFAPNSSGILKNIKRTSYVTTKNDILNIIKPNGKWIGKEGSSLYTRLFEGGAEEALEVFKDLTKDGKLINNNYPGKMYVLQDGTKIGFRPLSKSGPPTIDLDVPGYKNNIKLKFMEN